MSINPKQLNDPSIADLSEIPASGAKAYVFDENEPIELDRHKRVDLGTIRQVPVGGTTGQVVTKTASGYDWADAAGGGGGSTWELVIDSADIAANTVTDITGLNGLTHVYKLIIINRSTATSSMVRFGINDTSNTTTKRFATSFFDSNNFIPVAQLRAETNFSNADWLYANSNPEITIKQIIYTSSQNATIATVDNGYANDINNLAGITNSRAHKFADLSSIHFSCSGMYKFKFYQQPL